MGSPLSPILANLYMEYFESTLLPLIPEHLRPSVWLRYVDDVFAIWDTSKNIQDTVVELNNLVPSIEFTVEEERDNSIILDVSVIRTERSFKFKVFRKPTNNNLNYRCQLISF